VKLRLLRGLFRTPKLDPGTIMMGAPMFGKYAYIVLTLLLLFSIDAQADDGEALVADYSRQELFHMNVLPPFTGRALPPSFKFPDDVIFDHINNKPRDSEQFGVDVSHYDTNIDWKKLQAQHVVFAFIKASQGVRYKDPRFADHWDGIGNLPSDHGIRRGAYHFLSADGSGEDQASWFVKLVAGRLGSTDLPATLDLEWDIRRDATGHRTPCADGTIHNDCWELVSPDEIIRRTKKWLGAVECATGKVPLVYTGQSWWDERIRDRSKFSSLSHFGIWIFDYSKSHKAVETPAVPNEAPWLLWQFTSSAEFTDGGIPSSVDANVYKGSLQQFSSNFSVSSPHEARCDSPR
jgi:lysozyme